MSPKTVPLLFICFLDIDHDVQATKKRKKEEKQKLKIPYFFSVLQDFSIKDQAVTGRHFHGAFLCHVSNIYLQKLNKSLMVSKHYQAW